MAAFEILQHIGKLAGGGIRIERKHPVDDMIGAGLVGRVEIARLGRRLERPHDDPRRIRPQIERLPVQESGLRQGALGSLEEIGTVLQTLQDQALNARSGWVRVSPVIGARELAHLGKTEKIGHDRLAAAVLIGAIGMQPVAATAGLEVDQRDGQVVAAEEPCEGARRARLPLGIAFGAPRRKAGRDRRRCLDRLLIERRAGRCAVRRSRAVPTGRKWPAGAVCSVISQRRDCRPAST